MLCWFVGVIWWIGRREGGINWWEKPRRISGDVVIGSSGEILAAHQIDSSSDQTQGEERAAAAYR
jgi:hypothetical protein